MKSLKLKEPKTHTRHVSCGVFCITEDPAKLPIEYYKAYMTYMKLTNWAALIDNQPCVKATVNRLYWDADKKVNGDGGGSSTNIFIYVGIGAGALVLVAAVVVIIICWRRRHKSEDATAQLAEDD